MKSSTKKTNTEKLRIAFKEMLDNEAWVVLKLTTVDKGSKSDGDKLTLLDKEVTVITIKRLTKKRAIKTRSWQHWIVNLEQQQHWTKN